MNFDFSSIAPYLLHWYEYHARILPWRNQKEPYYIWVSEIMLQQTRAEAVKKYFERFIEAVPDISTLAAIPEDKLMKLWEGLGYYSRARNLKRAALMLVNQYHGRMPETAAGLLLLPGIGSYTAGAVASIAYSQPVPAVDGNALRVMMRIAGSFSDISLPETKKKLEARLLLDIPKDKPGEFNQAVMDLGAAICVPNGKPICSQCPVMHLCRAHQSGLENQIPVKTKKASRRVEEKTVFLIQCGRHFLVRKREDKGLLAGLYEFPNTDETLSQDAALHYLYESGYTASGVHIKDLGKAKHIFTHIEWHMQGYYIITDAPREKDFQETYLWADMEMLQNEIMIPSAFSAFHPMKICL